VLIIPRLQKDSMKNKCLKKSKKKNNKQTCISGKLYGTELRETPKVIQISGASILIIGKAL
jgi:hypothetical protein